VGGGGGAEGKDRKEREGAPAYTAQPLAWARGRGEFPYIGKCPLAWPLCPKQDNFMRDGPKQDLNLIIIIIMFNTSIALYTFTCDQKRFANFKNPL